jgi:NitT/TauT family transport system substrate-binding protein
MKQRSLVSALLGLIGLFAMLAVAQAQSLQQIKLLVPIRNVDEIYSPFVIAKTLGYYREEGLDVTIQPVNGSNEVAIQVAAGNGEFGLASPAQALIGLQSGMMDIRYFYSVYYLNVWSVAVPVDSPIKELKDLRGKRIGVPAMGSAAITYGRAYLNSVGLDPQRDVTFLPIGFGGQAFAATQQKAVDAIIFYDVALLQFESNGLKLRIIPIAEKFLALPDASLLARNDTLKKNPKAAIGLARAIAKAYDFTQANPEAAVKLTWNIYTDSKPKGTEEQVLRNGVAANQSRMKIWDVPKNKGQHGLFHAEDWQNVVSFMVDQKMLPQPVPVDRIYTNEMIGEINNYDRAAVSAQAKAFDASKLK